MLKLTQGGGFKGLRTFNNFLTTLIVLLGLYLISTPFLPEFAWWLKHDSPIPVALPTPTFDSTTSISTDKANVNRLIIPRLDMNEVINEGGYEALSKGVWRLPGSSTPTNGSNTVLVGHRFTYSLKAVFYHLDKVRLGDDISLLWQGQDLNYRVKDIKIVEPTEVQVQEPTSEPRLTIYTCTPLWSSEYRLVIIAKPIVSGVNQ